MFKEELDLYYLYINPARNEPFNRKESLTALRLILILFLQELKKIFRPVKAKGRVPDFSEKKIVFAVTYNNYEAVKFLMDKYPDALLVTAHGYVSKIKSSIDLISFLKTGLSFRKFFFLMYLAVQKKYRLRHFKMILSSYNYVERYTEMLTNNKPACIFISNDHYPHSRALILAAKKLGIKCFYIQHASVSEVFPPLRTSHALLYGQYSEKIYRNIKGSEGAIIPVGNHRFDSYKSSIINKKSTGRVGVAFNTLDPISEVIDLCEYLAQYIAPEQIVLRAHPADKRKFSAKFSVSPKGESSLDYLKGIDILVAGNSSILLEAAAMNVHALQMYFQPVPDYFVDYYGFIRTGVATEIKARDELRSSIQTILGNKKFDSRSKTRLYDASVGQPYEFDVENHIVAVVNGILTEK
jgi:hypothetical protein